MIGVVRLSTVHPFNLLKVKKIVRFLVIVHLFITNYCTEQKITRSLIDYGYSMCNKDIFKAGVTNSNLQVVKCNTGNLNKE